MLLLLYILESPWKGTKETRVSKRLMAWGIFSFFAFNF